MLGTKREPNWSVDALRSFKQLVEGTLEKRTLVESTVCRLFESDDPYLRDHSKRFFDMLAVLDRHKCRGPVLDLGTGPGHFAFLLSRRMGLEVIGLDKHDCRCREVILSRIDLVLSDLEICDLPFRAGSFNFVVFSEVVEHISRPKKSLEDVNRILRENGLLLLSTPNYARWINRVEVRKGGKPQLVHQEHVREYVMTELKRMLTDSGFSTEKVLFSNCWDQRGLALRPISTLLERSAAWLANLLVPSTRSCIVMLASKRPSCCRTPNARSQNRRGHLRI